jgi:hypothetical protein
MEVAKESSRKGSTPWEYPREGAVWIDTSMLRERKRGSSLSTLAMISSRGKDTLLSLRETLDWTSSHLVAGAFARDG